MDLIAAADRWLPEEDAVRAARSRAVDAGLLPVSAAIGSVLRLLCGLIGARAVVDTGPGGGVSGLWLLRGMQGGGALTCIDGDAEHLRLARQAYTPDATGGRRTRLIASSPVEVLPRLADGAYDLVHLHGAPGELVVELGQALRVTRAGGVIAVSGMAQLGVVDDELVGELLPTAIQVAGDGATPTLLPMDAGLLIVPRPLE